VKRKFAANGNEIENCCILWGGIGPRNGGLDQGHPLVPPRKAALGEK